jgi:hypothetical protein
MSDVGPLVGEGAADAPAEPAPILRAIVLHIPGGSAVGPPFMRRRSQ